MVERIVAKNEVFEKTLPFFPFRRPVKDASDELWQAWKQEYDSWWRKNHKDIPRAWITYGFSGILRSVEADKGKPWSETRIEAAINYRHSEIAQHMANDHHLTVAQLALVLAHVEISNRTIGDEKQWRVNNAIENQKKKGMSDDEVWTAGKIAEEIIAERKIFYVKREPQLIGILFPF